MPLVKTFKLQTNVELLITLDASILQQIKVTEVTVEDSDVSRAISDYVNANMIQTLVLGAPSRGIVG